MRMRSCALRILEAATISIALVIFRVFCTLRIFIRISLVPGILWLPGVQPAALAGCLLGCGGFRRRGSFLERHLETGTLLPLLDCGLERLLLALAQVFLFFHNLYQRSVLVLEMVAQRLFSGERLL